MHIAHKDSTTIWKTITKQASFFLNKYNQHIKHRFISNYFQSRSVIINVCLESLNGLHAVRGAQEPWEGVFGHQTVDPLLCLIECVCTQRVHHTQQSLPGLSVQVYLRGKQIMTVNYSLILTEHITKSRSFFCSHPSYNLNNPCCFHITLSSPPTNLLWGVRVDKLAVDAAGFGL